ncbi:MAG: putative DNA binding domain-containing protein [Eubacterium sp.]|nr:putative DNA binding domain-containing protein [Eubacterium sp.]
MQLEELIPGINLETKEPEFKGIIEEGSTKNEKKKEIGWLKTFVAYANTDGGALYIGVDNKTHKLVSLTHDKADQVVLLIHRLVREKVSPTIHYDIISHPVPNTTPIRYVLEVRVEKNRNLPVVLHEDGLLGIYIREFGQTRLATHEEIRDMVLLSENVPFDKPFTQRLYKKSDFRKFYDMAEEHGAKITEKALISVGFMSADKYLSEGALLFADDYSESRTLTVAAKWPGLDKGSAIVEADEIYSGNLIDIIRNTTAFIRNRSSNGYKKEEDGRQDYISYPMRSVTEGIVNAIGHRNYFISGSQIEINLFRDRLEIQSPGSLLGVRELRKEKNIASIIPRRRNEVICSILSMLKLMENKGSGFDTIEKEYSPYGEAYSPYVSSDATSFTLCLPDLTIKGGVVDENTEIAHVYVDGILTGKNDHRILAFCYAQPKDAKEIAEKIGITPSTYFRNEVLKRLESEGYLIAVKEGRKVLYMANHKNVHL